MKDIGSDLIADVTLYPTERGGRRGPTPAEWFGCPCTPRLDPPDYWDCRLYYETPIQPGEARRVAVKFFSKGAIPIFRSAGRFYLWEGRIIGEAIVIQSDKEQDAANQGGGVCEVNAMPPMVMTNIDAFQAIIGEQLSSITFVRDYWQFGFDGIGVTALTRIDVRTKGAALRDGDDQFRNVLCEQIGKIVKDVTFVRPEALTIIFGDQSSISVSLKWKDYRGPEALHLRGRDGFLSVVRGDG